jgi:TolB-like protein/Tfp pilus assembly protein PilF
MGSESSPGEEGSVADTPAKVPPEGEAGSVAAPAVSAPVAVHAAETPWLVSLWSRIKAHKIVQWTVAYAAFAFVTLHAATLVSDALEWPHVIVRALTLILMLGLPMAPILAWYHGVRALRRVSIPELILIVLLLVIAGALLWRSPHPTTEQARTETANPAVTEPVKPASTEPVFAPPAHSIAVLPFVNMSGDAKQEYFSDGITEELLNSLSRLNELQVVARTSSFSFKGQNVDVATIAHKLNVGALLEGSVRRAGNTVRITVQLIDAVSGFHLWSQTYDRELTDILKVQAEVAGRVAQQLAITLASDDIKRLDVGSTTVPQAYEAYLRGSELLSNWDTEDSDLRAALVALDQAIALDPNYALAYAKRATTLNDISIFVAKPGEIEGVRAEALQAARRAVALAPELGEAHIVLAAVLSNGLLDFAAAAPEFERALSLAPGSARVQRNFAGFSGQLGHFEAATTAARRAVSLDPQNVDAHITLGQVLTWARRFDEAQAALKAAAILRPHSLYVAYNIANALLAAGQFDQARSLCESVLFPPGNSAKNLCLALAYHALGRPGDAEKSLQQFKARSPGIMSVEEAGIYAQWGRPAQALQTLLQAERQRDPGFQVLKVFWCLDPIRSEPQFKLIEARMHYPP